MRTRVVFLAALLATGASGSPLVRLAASLADALLLTAKGRSLDIDTPQDRTGRGAGFALDVRGLVVERLSHRTALAETGPRLRVTWVLSETEGRLIASARVTDEPEGRLVDLVSISVATDRAVLPLATATLAASGQSTDVVAMTKTAPLEAPVLDVACLDAELFLVLHPDALLVLAWDGSSLRVQSRHALPGPFLPVRTVAGILALSHRDQAVWVLTNRSSRAVLFAIESGRLVRRQEADAVPWPGSTTGLRFRAGTDWLEGGIEGLGEGPFLRACLGEVHLAVRPDGSVVAQSQKTSRKLGSALAPLWTGLFAASSPNPPSESDTLLLVDQADLRVTDALTVEGTIRALGSHVQTDAARVVVGLQDAENVARLAIIDLKRREP